MMPVTAAVQDTGAAEHGLEPGVCPQQVADALRNARAYLPCLLLPWPMHALAPGATPVHAAVPGAPAGPLDDQALSRVATRIRPDRVSCSPGTPGWPRAGQYRSGLQAAARAGVTAVAGTRLRHLAREEN